MVAEARSSGTVASTVGSQAVQMGAPRRSTALANAQPRRVTFAAMPFGSRNSYTAPDTYLFYLNEPDPAASGRKPRMPRADAVLNPFCTLAAGGHPNVRDAEVYANAVIGALRQLVPEWADARSRVRPLTRP